MNKEQKNVTRLDVLDAIRDIYGRDLLCFIESDGIVACGLKISRKQYYTRLSRLIKAGIIKRKSGKYLLTPSGQAIFSIQLEFVEAVDKHFKSKVIRINQKLSAGK